MCILYQFKFQSTNCVHICVCVCVCACVCLLSHAWLFVTTWTIGQQTPLSVEFPGKNTGASFHFLLQGIFPTQALNPMSPILPADSLLLSHGGHPWRNVALPIFSVLTSSSSSYSSYLFHSSLLPACLMCFHQNSLFIHLFKNIVCTIYAIEKDLRV